MGVSADPPVPSGDHILDVPSPSLARSQGAADTGNIPLGRPAWLHGRLPGNMRIPFLRCGTCGTVERAVIALSKIVRLSRKAGPPFHTFLHGNGAFAFRLECALSAEGPTAQTGHSCHSEMPVASYFHRILFVAPKAIKTSKVVRPAIPATGIPHVTTSSVEDWSVSELASAIWTS